MWLGDINIMKRQIDIEEIGRMGLEGSSFRWMWRWVERNGDLEIVVGVGRLFVWNWITLVSDIGSLSVMFPFPFA